MQMLIGIRAEEYDRNKREDESEYKKYKRGH